MTHVARGGLMALLVVAALALGQRAAMAAPCTLDGEACRRSRRCCGTGGGDGVCVKAPGARSGVCCTPTGSEVCDGLDNDCNGTADDGGDALCDDGDACTVDACSAGACTHSPVSCDDGDACTVDACSAGACTHSPVSCNDGDACTVDACSAGACTHSPVSCNDANPCTVDSCAAGFCTHTLEPDGIPCEIGFCLAGMCTPTTTTTTTLPAPGCQMDPDLGVCGGDCPAGELCMACDVCASSCACAPSGVCAQVTGVDAFCLPGLSEVPDPCDPSMKFCFGPLLGDCTGPDFSCGSPAFCVCEGVFF